MPLVPFAKKVVSSPTVRRKPPSAVTAASQRLSNSDGALDKRPENYKVSEWQKQAWHFYDLIGELRYGARYYGNSLSQLRLHIGWKKDTGSAPTYIDPENPPEGFDRRQFAVAEETLARLHTNEGSLEEILRQFGVNLFVAGEGYLVGRTDPVSGGERWDFYSTEQLIWANGAWHLKESMYWRNHELIPLSDEDHVIRVWQPHPRFSDEPDSPLRSILSLCEELLLLSANVRATALSRIPAGILLMPETMLDAGPELYPENLNDDSLREENSQTALEEIYQHFITPISDPNSAAAVAPFILTGDPEDLEQVRLIEFDRDIDEIAADQRKEIIRRIAHGVDLPTEILSGMESINHWTAWQIEESSYKSHIRPAGMLFSSAITSSLIWPAVQAAVGAVDQRLVVTFDPIDLISHIDRRMNAKDGHAALVISDSTYRRALGFSEEDAPEDDEYKRRMAVQQASLTLTPVAAGEVDSVTEALDDSVARVRPGAPTPESIAADPDPRGRKPETEREVDADEAGDASSGPPEAVTASAVVPAGLGRKLVEIDKALLERLTVLSSAAMRRALEKAGARVRSRVSRDENLKSAIVDVHNFQVPSVLGEAVVASLFDRDLVLSEEFEDLEEQYDSLTARAQRQVRKLLRDAGVSEDELADLEGQHEVERREGWLLLSAALVATAGVLLYRPKVTSADVNGVAEGEFDDLALVQPRTVRAALSVAGGNLGVQAVGGAIIDLDNTPMGLLATGETTLTVLGSAGIQVVGYRWVYGDEIREPFEPHLDLDGLEFSDWTDTALTNSGSFPNTPFYFPGDHNGCGCLVEHIFSS